MSKTSRLEVIETGARRRWSPEEKQRIVAESFAVPRNVSATARRHGLSANQLFVWRRQAREGKFSLDGNGGFVSVRVSEPSPMASGGGRIEIVLSSPGRVIVDNAADLTVLAHILAMLELR